MADSQEHSKNRNTKINKGNYNESIDGNYIEVNTHNTQITNNNYYSEDNDDLLPESSKEELDNLKILSSYANDWIQYLEGTLKYKRDDVEDLEIKLKELPNAIQQNPGFELALYNCDENTTNKNLIDVFKKMGRGRKLLILGDIGSGKTTIILTLLKILIENYNDESNQPLPVFLNLSSWTNKQNNFSGWVIQEIVNRCKISKNIAEKLISKQKLMLLLDGLDEVNPVSRKGCIQKLNGFIDDNGRTEIILCSRLKEYENILSCNLLDNLSDPINDKNYCEENLKIRLRKAFYLETLEINQIERYLTTKISDLPLKILLRLLRKHQLLRNPLIVFIIMKANINIELLPKDASSNDIFKYLFTKYIEHMLTVKEDYFRQAYPKYYKNHGKTKKWLQYLANQLKREGIIFQIEQIQPSWLYSKIDKIIYRIVVGLTVGLILGLTSGLYFIYVTLMTLKSIDMTNDPVVLKLITIGLISGLITGLIEGIASCFNKNKNTVANDIGIAIGKQAQRLRIHRIYFKLIALLKKNAPNKDDVRQQKVYIEELISTTSRRFIRGGVPGIIFALFIWVLLKLCNLLNSENFTTYYSAIYLSCIFSGMSFSLMRDEIKVAKIGSMDLKKIFICSLNFTFLGIPYVIARLWLLPEYYKHKDSWFPIYELMIFMIIGAIYGAVIIKKDKPNKSQIENHQRNILDNEIINLKNYAILSFVSLIFAGILVGWFIDSIRTPVVVCLGLAVGLLGGLAANEGAGIVCIQHFTLRTILYLKGYIPTNYAQFLNYANERGLLNKVGNSYFFIGKLLDYFTE